MQSVRVEAVMSHPTSRYPSLCSCQDHSASPADRHTPLSLLFALITPRLVLPWRSPPDLLIRSMSSESAVRPHVLLLDCILGPRDASQRDSYVAPTRLRVESRVLQLTITCNRPHAAFVPIECTQPLSVRRVPYIDDAVLRGREQQITLGVEDDLRERSLVSLEDDRFLWSARGVKPRPCQVQRLPSADSLPSPLAGP